MAVTDEVARIPTPTVDELYDAAPCGYLTTTADGTIAHANARVLGWTGYSLADLVGRRRLADLFRVGGRIYYETHYAPLLLLQGRVDDVAFELIGRDGDLLPVMACSTLIPAVDGTPAHIQTTLVDARGRREYERELQRARLEAEASETRANVVATALQHSLMQGGLRGGDGFTIEARYRPAVASLDIGGDWHDAFELDQGNVSMTVGDVVGRGLSAAAAMGQIRAALRALSYVEDGPGVVLDRLDRFVERVPGAWMATVAIVEIAPATGEVRYASAGHLPALVVDPDGSTRLLWDGRSPPLAAVALDGPRPQATTTIRPGSRLLLCTDGLIERQSRDIDVGLDRWAACAATHIGLEPRAMVDRMMDELLDDEELRDDVCLVCFALDDPSG
jgi:phosphoserine phosphatase RsbU/P